MKVKYSDTSVPEVMEGDVIVATKYRGKLYAKAFKLNSKNIGSAVKASIEATKSVICEGEN